MMLRILHEAAAVMAWERLPYTWKINKYLWLGRDQSIGSLTEDLSVIWIYIYIYIFIYIYQTWGQFNSKINDLKQLN